MNVPTRPIMALCAIAMMLALPCRAAEKLPTHPKLVYRQLGAGWTLALETARREKTCFLCAPNKIDCISTREIGWRKPFIIIRDGNLIRPGYGVLDTSSPTSRGPVNKSLASHLKTVPIYPAAVAWKKLSPTRPLW